MVFQPTEPPSQSNKFFDGTDKRIFWKHAPYSTVNSHVKAAFFNISSQVLFLRHVLSHSSYSLTWCQFDPFTFGEQWNLLHIGCMAKGAPLSPASTATSAPSLTQHNSQSNLLKCDLNQVTALLTLSRGPTSLRVKVRVLQGRPKCSVPSASIPWCPPGLLPHLLPNSLQLPWKKFTHTCTHTFH